MVLGDSGGLGVWVRSDPREMAVSDATEVVAEELIGSVTGGIIDQK